MLMLLIAALGNDVVVVAPAEDEQAVLRNPDMGWVVYENYPIDPRPGGASNLMTLPDENFDGVDHVAIMFAWSDVEPEADRYDFSKVDHAYDHWHKRGKQIQLRMSTESLLWWNQLDPPAGLGVPQYVLDALPAEAKQTRQLEGIAYVVVDARQPLYLERLERFLAAVRRHFDDDRPVTLIDLRAFGVWGEWHSGYRYATEEDRRAALIGIIDLFSDSFPDHRVALSYSYDPDGPAELFAGPTNRYDERFTASYRRFLRFSAFDHALTKENVTFRRDGAGGAVHSNERRLCEQAFAMGKGPMMCEFVDGYHRVKNHPQRMAWMIEDALSLHPNYVNLLGWQTSDARDFLREQPESIAHGGRTMGYRLVPTRVTYPRDFRGGAEFEVSIIWINRGVGRALRDYRLELRLADLEGTHVSTCDAGPLDTSEWIKGQEYGVVKRCRFTGIAAGRYQLRLCLVDPKDERPIALPLKEQRADGSYSIGEIRCR